MYANGELEFLLRSVPFEAPLVIAEPEVRVARVKDGDELLLACDGLWDVLTAKDAFNFLHSRGVATNPHSAVQELVQAADEVYNSMDNITAVYVQIRSPPC